MKCFDGVDLKNFLPQKLPAIRYEHRYIAMYVQTQEYAQNEELKKESPQGLREKPHIMSQAMAQNKSDQIAAKSDQVTSWLI